VSDLQGVKVSLRVRCTACNDACPTCLACLGTGYESITLDLTDALVGAELARSLHRCVRAASAALPVLDAELPEAVELAQQIINAQAALLRAGWGLE